MSCEVNVILHTLNNCQTDNLKSGFEAKQALLNLKKYFESNSSASELDLAFSALFDEKTGILNYAQKRIVYTKYKLANTELFHFLYFLIEKYRSRLSQHILSIKKICVMCEVLDCTSADEKEMALEALHSIVLYGPWNQELEVGDLFQTLLLQVCSKRKRSSKVLEKKYHLLGLITRYYPETVVQHSEKLLKQFLYELEVQTCRASKVEFPVIAGCIKGLTEFLHKFGQSEEREGSGYCKKIHGTLKKLADIDALQTRKVANREALVLLWKHGSQFPHLLFDDYLWWHKTLLKWLDLSMQERRVAFFALETFYQQMARVLCEKSEEKQVFMYFIEFFKERLLSSTTSPHELRVTIKAFGQFAGPCQVHMTKQDVSSMLSLIVQRIEQMYIQSSDQDDSHVADHMQSLASILSRLEGVSPTHLAALERITVSLVHGFPRLVGRPQSDAIDAFVVTLHYIASCPSSLLDHFVHNVVYQGIVQTCSHPVALDVELEKDQDSVGRGQFITYKSYVPLWKSLLSITPYNKLDTSLLIKQMLVSKMYDEVIDAVLTVVKKLDLTTRMKTKAPQDGQDGDREAPLLDPESGLEAVTPQDFQAFINLVDLCRDLLLSVDHQLFEKWTSMFTSQIVAESYRRPLVSGFYKLVAISLQLADKLHFFNDMDIEERELCHKLLCHFLQDVLLRQKEHKGDLQVACLQTLLVAPTNLVEPLIPFIAPAFQMVFHVGGSYLPLAHSGMEALERWDSVLPRHTLEPLLKQILPFLNPFLQSKGIRGELEAAPEPQSRGRHRRWRKNLRPEEQEAFLTSLQGRIVRFIGRLDSSTALSLIGEETSINVSVNQQQLKYCLPFADVKPTIQLDSLVPRVVELALRSSDRRIRVTACELLHAVIMVMLGNSVQLASSDPAALQTLFEQLAMPLLQLGCDTDQVVYQLFNPLMLQLVHWYSSKFQLKSRQTSVLINTLMDGITHESDTAVRDFSAKCLREFVIWSLKQQTPLEAADSPVNVKVVLTKIHSFCVHPSPTKRLGAALIFNSIYTVLREEESVLDVFWLELLYYMVLNLDLVDRNTTRGHSEQVGFALDHILRGLLVKASLFNQVNQKRHKVPGMEDATLKGAVRWLLHKCSSLNAECRHKCMDLVAALAPHVPGCSTLRGFIAILNPKDLLDICENANNNMTLASINYPVALRGDERLEEQMLWFSAFLRSLDIYVWLIGKSLINAEKFFSSKSIKPQIFHAMYLFQSILLEKSYKFSFSNPSTVAEASSPWELETFNYIKCSAIIRMFDFLKIYTQMSGAEECFLHYNSDFLSDLFEIISKCVFNPKLLGFDTQDLEIKQNLPARMEEFLLVLNTSSNIDEHREKMTAVFKKDIQPKEISLLSQLKEICRTDFVPDEQREFLKGLRIVCSSWRLPCELTGERIIDSVFSAIADSQGSTELGVSLQPNSRSHTHELLRLAFSMGEQVDKIITCLQNERKLKNPETKSVTSHGDHFLLLMKDPVLNHLLAYPDQTVRILLSSNNLQKAIDILLELPQHIANKKCFSSNTSSDLESSIFSHWPVLKAWAQDVAGGRQVLSLLSHLASVLTPVGWLHDDGHHQQTRQDIATWVLSQMSAENHDIEYKTKALEMLPCLTGPRDSENKPLSVALKTVKDQHFPQSSREMAPESKELSAFIAAFQNILLGLELSGSPMILHSVIAMTSSEKDHVCEPAIQSTLCAFIAKLDETCQVQSIQVTYDIFSSECYNWEARLGCVQRFTASLLRACSVAALRQFYIKNVASILALLNAKLEKRDTWKLEQQLVGRSGAWHLIEIMFARLDKTYLEDKSCAITKAAFPDGVQTGKELIADITRRAFGGRTEELTTELARQSQCAAYNALIAIISNTKTEAKFYAGLLFLENTEKGQLIWERIVDCTKQNSFPLDCDEIPTRRKQLVSIRKQTGESSTPPSYIASGSQYLFNSTLSEDITKFDMSNCLVKSLSDQKQFVTLQEAESCNLEISLESDELNDHECMAMLCGVIRHMVGANIAPLPKPDVAQPLLPTWMENLKKSFQDAGKHKNARMFIARLVLNTKRFFRPYARYWVGPLMSAVADNSFGNGINSLIADTVTMAASWGSVAIDGHVARAVLELLMSHCGHARKDIFKHNLDLIRTFVEVWKSHLEIPYNLILQSMSPGETTANGRGSETGIQLAGILLTNGICPWNEGSKPQFLECLAQSLENSKRDIWQPASEVIGMSLKMLDPENTGKFSTTVDQEFFKRLNDKLHLLSQMSGVTELGKFLTCLKSCHKHYSCIIDKYLTFIIFNTPRLYGTAKRSCLEMILSRLELLGDDVYRELTSAGLQDWMKNKDEQNQELALLMVNKIMELLSSEQLEGVIEDVCNFSLQKNRACRAVMYNLLMQIYEQRKDCTSIQEKVKATLLKGLVDTDPELQDTIQKFWSNVARLPTSTTGRLTALLADLYNSQMEPHFLGYCTQFVLELANSTPDYNRPMFMHPLSQCKFEPMRVAVSWRAQHATIAPMFAETLASQLSIPQSLGPVVVRSTQATLAFEPTQQEGVAKKLSTPSFPSSSSLLFTVGSSGTSKSTFRTELHRNISTKLSEQERDEGTSSSFSSSRRFLKDQNRLRFYFAGRELRKQARREEWSQNRARRREANVNMYRTYRIGDFPDIEITNAALLKPLQILAKHDVTVARQVFVSVLTGVLAELNDEDAATFTSDISRALTDILSSSVLYTPTLMAALLEVALGNTKAIQLDSELIALVSRNSGQVSLGCLLIEERLIHSHNDDKHPVKRTRGVNDPEQQNWLKLAELYSCLGEWDVVRSIFSQHLTDDEDVHKALAAESVGLWYHAKTYYQSVLEDSHPTETHKEDYYYQAYYKCLAHMSHWSELDTHVRHQMSGDWEEVWVDPWNKENLLQWLLSCSLHIDRGWEELLTTVQTWLEDVDKSSYLMNEFSEELSVLFALKPDFSRARYYVERSMVLFFDNWMQISPTAEKLRVKALLNTQTLAEIKMYLEFAGLTNMVQYESQARRLVSVWRSKLPTETDPLLLWDTRMTYRKHFINQIKTRLPGLSPWLEEARNHMELALSSAAIEQSNFYLARKYIDGNQKKAQSECSPLLKSLWKLNVARLRWLLADISDSVDEKLTWFFKSLSKLDQLKKTSPPPSVLIKLHQQESVTVKSVLKLIETEPSLAIEKTILDQFNKSLSRRSGSLSSLNDAVEALEAHSLSALKNGIDIAKQELDKNVSSREAEKTVADSYLQLGQFCLTHWQKADESVLSDLITSILRAMKHGSGDARQLFPCLLQIPQIATELHLTNLFVRESTNVPVWMFLGWVSQILACLDSQFVFALDELIVRMAESYPNAVKYPFRLSLEKYTFADTPVGAKSKNVIESLRSRLLQDQLSETMVKAFHCLSQPHLILRYHLDRLLVRLEEPLPDLEVIKRYYQEMLSEVFPSTITSVSVYGKIFEKVYKFKTDLENIFGPDASLVEKSGFCGDALSNLEKIRKKLVSEIVSHKSNAVLKDYSPYLSKYQSVSSESTIEIPGQYDGESRPLTQHHITISAFSRNVKILPSIRRPLRIGILGNDAKERYYLVKYGEDLCQDQRIQQLFRLMNKIISQDSNCNERKLSLATYQVIPLSSRLGLIQWVNDTVSLKELILETLSDEERKEYQNAQRMYDKWTNLKSSNKQLLYEGAYLKYSRDETIAAYREKVNMIPWDVLRQAIMGRSSSHEAFFILRHNLAVSYATMCAANWLLGIGDRHLSNVLLMARRGAVLGIDFGHAFGTATHVMGVPELMPFRLTPHIVNLMQPLQENGLLMKTMCHCLRALRSEGAASLLLSTMQVFVQEPSIDWLQLARKKRNLPTMGNTLDEPEWFPRVKIQTAKKKLTGENPASITCEELRLGYSGTFLEKCLEVASGDPRHNVRARLPKDGLTVEQQVQCLIDQATDFHILGKTWIGWEPWV